MEKYNGWTNYETWAVNLWLTNDEGTYRYWRDRAADYKRRPDATDAEINLAEELKETLSEHEFEGLYADLLNAALDRVNWHEIASSLLEDV